MRLQLGLALLLTANCLAHPFNNRRIQLNDSAKLQTIEEGEKKHRVGLEDFLQGKFGQLGFNGNWVSGKEFSFYNDDGDFALFNIETGDSTVLLEKEKLAKWERPSLTLNSDNSKVLIRHASKQLFRHSIIAKYTVLDLDSDEEYNLNLEQDLQNCIWSPAGDALAYVFENNVFLVDIENREERPVTEDGSNKVYNGITDWVYEEEVFGTDNALWFNPDGSKLVFGYFDDTEVKVASYFMYNEVKVSESEEISGQYPEKFDLNYPKVGTPNPVVKVKIVDTQDPTGQILEIEPPSELDQPILSSVGFVNNRFTAIMWQNRRQNQARVKTYNLENPQVERDFLEKDEPNGWIDASTIQCYDYPVGDPPSERCFLLQNEDGWKRLVQVANLNKEQVVLTPRGMTVLAFLGWSLERDEAYVLGTGYTRFSFKNPAFRHLYAIRGEAHEVICLSCEVKSPEDEECTYVSNVRFSKDLSYYSLTCSGPGPAYSYIFKIGEEQPELIWETNEKLRETLKSYHRTSFKYFLVPVTGGFNALVKCHMPLCYSEEAEKKFPLIVQVYGGPNSVRVLDNFGVGYGDYLAQTRNVVYCSIDGRGSGNKGTDLLFTINNALGTVEIEDQIAVTKYLRDNNNFIDGNRIGIWGWSYGGYATGMVLTHDSEHVFQGGVSVAPVSSWIYYDTIYTERYMGEPKDNMKGYNASDLTRYADDMRGHEYLLIHGNADDNVHYQQAMVWAKELQKEDILFEQQSYPNEAHSLSGVQKHLYHTLDEFWQRTVKWTESDAECDK